MYPGVLHAVAVGAGCRAPIVDLTHDVPPYDVAVASFLLTITHPFLPAGSVVAAVVDPGVGSDRRGIIVQSHDRWIVAPDNGLARETVEDDPGARAWALDPGRVQSTFPEELARRSASTFDGRDLFVPAAVALLLGAAPGALGDPIESIAGTRDAAAISESSDALNAPGRWIDPFGNILTAVTVDRVARFGAGKPLHATVAGHDLGEVVEHYVARPGGTLTALANSWGRIEVACTEGNAASVLGVRNARDVLLSLRRTP